MDRCPLCAASLSAAWQDPLVSFQTREEFRIVPLARFPGSFTVQVKSAVDGTWEHAPMYLPFNFSYRSEAAAEEAIGHWLWLADEHPSGEE